MKLPIVDLAHITGSLAFGAVTSDFRLDTAARLSDGTVLIGGFTTGADADNALWLDQPRQDLHYWGYWAMERPGIRATADELGIDEATGYEGSDEIARVPDGTDLTARFGIAHDDTDGAVTWAWKLCDAATGAVIDEGEIIMGRTADGTTSPVVTLPLPALDDGTSALLWVWIEGATRLPVWPPPDYREVTGQSSQFPAAYRWIHPLLGAQYYDPIWNVGSRPYDTTDPVQAALLTAHTNALNNGMARKYGPWSSYLATFAEDGGITPQTGEYARLKIVAGEATEWLGDGNVHPDCYAGIALWTISEGPTPLYLTPDLRSVGGILETDGVVWIAGMGAGRSGQELLLLSTAALSIDGRSSQPDTVTRAICECAMRHTVTGFIRFPDAPLDDTGRLWITTVCELYRRNEDGSLTHTEPGGRSPVVSNGHAALSCEHGDFASNDDQIGFGHLVEIDAIHGTARSAGGPAVAHQVDSCLADYKGHIYAIHEDSGDVLPLGQTAAQRAANRQYLVRYDGQGWRYLLRANNVPYSWLVGTRDMARLGRCGDALLVFGFDAEGAPTVIRYRGGIIKAGLSTEYIARRLVSCLSADGARENLLVIGEKVDSSGWWVGETAGKAANDDDDDPDGPGDGGDSRVCAFWNAGAGEFRFTVAAAESAGFVIADLPPYLSWQEQTGAPAGGKWQRKTALPSQPYLALVNNTTFISYVPHGTLPYDPLDWGQWCFYLDGSTDDARPRPTCTDAGCVASSIEGARVFIFKLKQPAPALMLNEFLTDELRAALMVYPCLWLRLDGETPAPAEYGSGEEPSSELLTALAGFDIWVPGLGKRFDLPRPARLVEVAVVVPEGTGYLPVGGGL